MSVKVKVQGSLADGMKTVTFDDGERQHVYLMPEALAKALEIRLNAMWSFKHGILRDGALHAMFRDEADRDEALQALRVHPSLYLEPFSTELA